MARTLMDLFRRGEDIELNDGSGDPVKVHITKLTTGDRDEVVRKANAARSRMRAALRDTTSDEYLSVLDEVEIVDRETQTDAIVAYRLRGARFAIERQVAANDEWSEDGYLDGLQAAWENGLSDVFATMPDNPEARRVYEELKRFDEEVEQFFQGRLRDERASIEILDDAAFKTKAIERATEEAANTVWIAEFLRWKVYFCTRRVDDRAKRYFSSIQESDQVDPNVRAQLLVAIGALEVDAIEGKSLPSEEVSSL